MLYYRISEILFRTWFGNFVAKAVANATALNLSAGEVTALTDALDDYEANVSTYTSAHDAAKAATVNKNASYEAALALVKLHANEWQANPAVSDALKLELGLNIRDTSPSPRPIFPVTEFAATGNSVGTVKLRWNRNGNLSGCTFFVEKSVDGGDWTFVTATSKTRFALSGQAMVPTMYRVRVERRGQFSEPCDFAGVYGGVTAPTLTLMEDAA